MCCSSPVYRSVNACVLRKLRVKLSLLFAFAEFKVTYKRQAEHASQTYRFSIYVFYPRELEAVQTNFFSHMFQNTRLHTPEVMHEACCDAVPMLIAA